MNDEPHITNPDDVEARTMFLKDQYFKKQLKQAEGGLQTMEVISTVLYIIAVIVAFVMIYLTIEIAPREVWMPLVSILVFTIVGMHFMHMRIRHLEKRFDSILNSITQMKEKIG